MNPNILNNATEQKLFRAFMQFHKAEWHEPTIGGCRPSEIRVLFCVRTGDKPDSLVKVSDISKRLRVTSPTVTQIVNNLETNGLVERRSDPTDRRSVGIILTKRGEEVTQQAADAFSSSMQGLIDYLGEEESNQLADLLFKVFHYYQEKASAVYDADRNGANEL
jgi:DNA-binding MarR family transcriptional regulator